MNRLQKKCLVVSIGLHALLLSLLVVGPAFVAPKEVVMPNLPPIDFIPLKTTDEAVSGGGNPEGRLPTQTPAPAHPPRRTVAPSPPPMPAPEPVRERPRHRAEPERQPPVRQEKPEPETDSLKPARVWKPRKPVVNTDLVTRQDDSRSRARQRAEQRAREAAERQAEREAAQRRELASQIGEMAQRLGSDMSSGVRIELKGPGGGGVPYANFLQAVYSVYDRAWVLPSGVTDSDAVAVASVTIARDGTVVSARITRPSGNPGVDRSVREALDRVTYAAPLPDSASEKERTVTISFSARAKRNL